MKIRDAGGRETFRFCSILHCLVFSWVLCAPSGMALADPAGLKITVASAAVGTEPQIIKAIGTVVPFQTVAIRSRLDSQIMDIKFKDGDSVKKGDILFVLDDRALKAQKSGQDAVIAKDRVQLADLGKKLDRVKKLIAENAVSQQALEDAQSALDTEKTVLAADQAALTNIDTQLDYVTIRAPMDGRTGTIGVNIGNLVKANDTVTLVTINQVKPVLAQASLPQSDLYTIRQAMKAGDVPVTAVAANNAVSAAGTLRSIDNAVATDTGTFAARAVFANDDENLWPGMMVTLNIKVGEAAGTVSVPEQAVQHGEAGDYVFVIAGGKAHKTPVSLNQSHDGRAFVKTGLHSGDMVATSGFMNLDGGVAVATEGGPGR